MKISIIVPVLNEEEILLENFTKFEAFIDKVELIFTDGGSSDQTISICSKLGQVVQAPKGRAVQMNLAAQHAQGDVLLFLHADTVIDVTALDNLTELLKQGYIGGCFRQVIQARGLLYRWIAFTGNFRAQVSKIFYGDQGIFVLKSVFDEMRGFPHVLLAEDVYFTKSLREKGKTKMLRTPIYCSDRRWRKQGLFKTFFINMKVSFCLMMNHDINKIAHCYHDVR